MKYLASKVKPGSQHTLRVPGNGISTAGVNQIVRVLNRHSVYSLAAYTPDWKWLWRVGGKGEYVGTLPKRVQKWCYQRDGVKLTPDVISAIGNLGTQHCDKAATYYFDFDQKIDWRDGDYGDAESCIMSEGGCHSFAKQVLRHNGCWAMRFYSDPEFESGVGRAWVWDEKDHCILLNGYWDTNDEGGSHSGGITLKLARILAQFLDNAYYHQVSVSCDSSHMYINAGVGYAIGDYDVVAQKTSARLPWTDPEPEEDDNHGRCPGCDRVFQFSSMCADSEDTYWCNECFGERYCRCCECGLAVDLDDPTRVVDGDGSHWCHRCAERCMVTCKHCRQLVRRANCTELHRQAPGDPSRFVCVRCRRTHYVCCAYCGNYALRTTFHPCPDGASCCAVCAQRLLVDCPICHQVTARYRQQGYLILQDGYYLRRPGCGTTTVTDRACVYTAELEATLPKDIVGPSARRIVRIGFKFPLNTTCQHCQAELPPAEQAGVSVDSGF